MAVEAFVQIGCRMTWSVLPDQALADLRLRVMAASRMVLRFCPAYRRRRVESYRLVCFSDIEPPARAPVPTKSMLDPDRLQYE